MASANRRTEVEIVFPSPHLKNCLVNLPGSLVSLLLNANTLAQNVVVELQWRQPTPSSQEQQRGKPASSTVNAFLGWTGYQSAARMGSLVGREGVRGGSEKEGPTVEMDATFARRLGLSEGMKVGCQSHKSLNMSGD